MQDSVALSTLDQAKLGYDESMRICAHSLLQRRQASNQYLDWRVQVDGPTEDMQWTIFVPPKKGSGEKGTWYLTTKVVDGSGTQIAERSGTLVRKVKELKSSMDGLASEVSGVQSICFYVHSHTIMVERRR